MTKRKCLLVQFSSVRRQPVLVIRQHGPGVKSGATDGERNRHGRGSKLTCVILLCPWKRHFTVLISALRF